MIKVAICDDDKAVLEKVRVLLESICKDVSIKTYDDEKIILEENIFDIVFMDIEIKDKSGIDFAIKIRERCPDCIIIFITNYTCYISDAFDAIPFQYLIKPLDENKLISVFNKALSTIKKRKKYVPITWNGQTELVECFQIIYFERCQRNVLFHMQDGKIKKSSKKFIEYITMLESYNFIRSHNSILVNISFIKALKQYNIILENNEVVPISKKYLLSVREAFIKKQAGEIVCQ